MKPIFHLKNAPWLKISPLLTLFDIYHQAGADIRLVGGCVRDSLLDVPINDWDLTTNALPEESLNICQNAGLHVIPTGLKHGTITAILNHIPFEITTLRIDEKTDGRHAEVNWTKDWQQDAARRDFTVNALYADEQGYVYDYFGGIDDLHKGIIRFVGTPSQRVEEDYLRILRFFRFMARFGNFHHIHHDSLIACCQRIEGLLQISTERIRDELIKILIGPYRHEAIRLMEKCKIFDILNIPLKQTDLKALDDIESRNHFASTSLRGLAFILSPTPSWQKLAGHLKFSNKQKKHLSVLQPFMSMQQHLSVKDLRKIAYRYGLIIAQDVYLLKHHLCEQIATEDWPSLLPPPLPINGSDLLKKGIKEGPDMGKMLKQLENDYIKSDFSLTHSQLLAKI